MSRLTEIQRQILQLEESRRIASLRLLSNAADKLAASMLLMSGRAIDQLRSELIKFSEKEGIGVMNYTLAKHESRLHAAYVGSSLYHFQRLMNAAAESVATKMPVERMDSSNSLPALALDWGHELELDDGTRSFLFLADCKASLFDEKDTTIDRTIDVLEEFVHLDTSDAVLRLSGRYGRASVKAVDEWAKANMLAGCTVGVDWLPRGRRIAPVDPPQWHRLHAIINAKATEEPVPVELSGTLIGAVLDKQRFWIETDDGEVISGKFLDDLISEKSKANLPARYDFRLTRKLKVTKATGAEKVEWTLNYLRPL